MKAFLRKLFHSFPIIRRYIDRINRLESVISHSRSPALSNSVDDFLTERLLSHPAINPLPNVRLASHPATDNPNRITVAERLLAAYHNSIKDGHKSQLKQDGEDIWTGLMHNELSELMAIMERNDAENLARYLMHFGEKFVWFGGITTCIDGYNRNLDPHHIAVTYLDKLICLGEYLGLIRFENPESGPWGINLQSNIDELVNNIEKSLEISISPPLGIIHTDGLATSTGVFHYRHINGLYSALRIKELNQLCGPCCEFGGGLGITAMYARRMGVLDYTILDLPLTCLLAGHFLLHAVGLDAVSLYGEPPSTNKIKILPYWEVLNLPDNYFYMSINQDSFPEIADNLVREYIKQIHRFTTNYFLSINHECFFPKTVDRFITQSAGLRRIYRAKYWVREGYLEELYRIQ